MTTPLTDSINALTAYANEVTGGSDTTLSDAVHTLASGYGGGNVNVEFGTYTPTEDVFASQTHIVHSLGKVPDFIVVVADTFTASSDMTVRYISNAYCAKSNLVASNKNANGYSAYQGNWHTRDMAWMSYENIDYTKFLHANTFEVPYYSSSDKLKTGITYRYVIGCIT